MTLGGCTSISHQTASSIPEPAKKLGGKSCQNAVQTASVQNEIKWGRMVATPILTLASAGLFPALLGANAALDYADRKNASNMRKSCGMTPVDDTEILTEVATNMGLSIGLSGFNIGVDSEVSN